ncbi:MAG: OB-fold nucleic acid binding domain-containing protein, partial [Chloroflexota bacterium]|nr:OB-fold nucleic acid binding domain-containing protein [Chloroflexota bacterium]
YISEHPVAQALAGLPDDPNRLTLGLLDEAHIGQKVEIIGMLTGLRKVTTKRGETMLTAQIEDLEGSIDIVAFPKTYEKYSSFWKDDNVVAIAGKVDNRRDSLQLVVDTVAPYTEAVTAAPVVEFAPVAAYDGGFPAFDDADVPPPDDPGWSFVAPVAASPTTTNGTSAGHRPLSNGNGMNGQSNGNGYTTGNDRSNGTDSAPDSGAFEPSHSRLPTPDSQPPTPNSQPPTTVIRPRQRIQIAKKDDETRAAAPAPSGPQYHLHLTLCRSADFDADVRCMQEVDRALRRFAGEHKVSLYIPREDCNVVLEPLHRITPAPELITTLKTLLGESQVMLEGGS